MPFSVPPKRPKPTHAEINRLRDSLYDFNRQLQAAELARKEAEDKLKFIADALAPYIIEKVRAKL